MSAALYKTTEMIPSTMIDRSEDVVFGLVWVIKRSILSLPIYITLKKNLKSVIDSAVLHWTTRLMVFPRNVGSGGGGGALPYITYTGMCRPTRSWFWSSWFRTGYPFQRRFLERGIKNCGSRLLLKIFADYGKAFIQIGYINQRVWV